MKSLSGKAAIVTGASRGIGRAIALRLAAEGASLVLVAREQERLDAAAAEIESAGGTAAALALDLRTDAAAGQLTAFSRERFGAIDILVNNAGATKRGDFLDLTDDEWQDGFALKFFGAVRLSRAAWPSLAARRGSLVFISGVGGRTPGAEFTIGGSVNAALLALTKALADRGVRDGVQVNTINPGAVRTDRLATRLAAQAAAQGVSTDAAAARFVSDAQITRIGEPDDIAGLVQFVVSPAGRWLQGALLDMDGGQTKTI